ncbi:acylcarnitine hydrolase-like [Babylonia areolata]|uniref:acylcarnitine hydrolase-like n=1 Tax=Babylonia areolata TaxID=304850 RepID=UPI003FD4F4E6
MPACPQLPLMIGSRPTSEDCLKLDVYTPYDVDSDVTNASPRAVMVFIHGGGLTMGDAYTYRPSKLVVDGGVIVVVLQYRLGVLGFLSSGDGILPDNLGLWDQNLALRWVKVNAAAFGGDPERITLFGESAGSWSVGLHLVIPRSRGLFHRAIMQSGASAPLSRFSEFLDFRASFRGLADLLGCQGEGSGELVRCLKRLPVDVLVSTSAQFSIRPPLYNLFYPTVDGDLIPREPHDLLREGSGGDVDVILGFNNLEGSLIAFFQVFENLPPEMLFSAEFFRGLLDMCSVLSGVSNHPVLKKTAEFFYRRTELDSSVSQTLGPVADVDGDCVIVVPVVEWSRLLASAPHSAARFLYHLDHHFLFNSQGPLPGAQHGDELCLLFDMDKEALGDSVFVLFNKTQLSEEEKVLSQRLVAMWTSFAKTGNPSAPLQDALRSSEEEGGVGMWPEFGVEREEYLSISLSPRVVPHLGPYRDRVALWLGLLPQLSATLTTTPPPPAAASGGPEEGGEGGGQGSDRDEL